MGAGAGMGRGIAGYYGAKSARNASEDHDYEQKRKREITDPRDDQINELRLQVESMQTALKTVKFPGEVQGALDAETNRKQTQKYEHGINVDVENARADTETNRVQQQKNMPSITDDTEEARNWGVKNDRQRQGYAEQNIDDQQTLHDYGMNTAEQQDEEGTYRFDTRKMAKGAMRGKRNYDVTGDPKALEDGYNMGVDDDHDIEYVRSPVGPDGEPSDTAWAMNSKSTGKQLTVYADQEELAASYNDFWNDPAAINEAYNMGGSVGRSYADGGVNTRRSGSGRGGTTGVKNQEIQNLAAAYLQTEEGQGATEAEAYMYAWEKASMSKQKAPIDYVNGLYVDLIKSYTKPDQFGRTTQEQIENGKKEAYSIAKQFADQLGVDFDPMEEGGTDTVDYYNSVGGGVDRAENIVADKTGR
jgi:hypothetical protein